MSARVVAHSTLILTTLFVLALIQRSAVAVFLPQILGVLVVVYFLSQVLLWRKWVASHHEGWIRDSEAVMFVVMGVILVELTGGLSGPLAFVLYLLILYLGVLLEPGISFAVAVGLVVYFLPTVIPASAVIPACPESVLERFWSRFACQNDNPLLVARMTIDDLIRLASLLIMVPFAMLFTRRSRRAK